jgi:hypothetical protein
MKPKALVIILFTSILSEMSLAEVSSDLWDQANQEIRRLPPEIFANLPDNILKELKKRGCTIPQSYASSDPHNVIQGQFQAKGQMDWAVLCSSGNKSSILVFWGGDTRLVSQIAKSPDKNWLQVIADRKIAYSRHITSVGADAMREHYRAEDGSKPPLFDHEGIDDAFLEKGSSVHYWHDGNWLELTGPD